MRPDGLRSIEELGARYPHGTRLRCLAGCRCLPCRSARSRYESERQRLVAEGITNRIVPAARARAHLRKLSRLGVGYKTVADVAGVACSIVAGIRSGRRRNCREETERAILGVTRDAARPGAYIDAAQTWRLVHELLAAGWSKARIAYSSGHQRGALQIGRHRCTRENADRIAALHQQATRRTA